MAFLGSDILDPNAYVTIKTQVASQVAGGTVLSAGTTVEDNVPVIVSVESGARDGRLHMDLNASTGRFSGESSNLSRQDVTILFKSTSLAGVPVGFTARLLDVTGHPASPDGWVPARYSGRWEVVGTGAGV